MANITIFPAASGTYTPNASGLPNIELDHGVVVGKTNISVDVNGLVFDRAGIPAGGITELQIFNSGEINAGYVYGSGGNATFAIRTQTNRTALNINRASGAVADFLRVINSGNNFVAGFNSSGTFSGNAQTVTSFQNSRLINSGSFDGTGNIVVKSLPYASFYADGLDLAFQTFDGSTSGQRFNVTDIRYEKLQANSVTIGSTNSILNFGQFSGSNYISGLLGIQSTYFAGILSGDCSRAALLVGGGLINGNSFIGDQNITITAATNNNLSFGSGFQTDTWNGSTPKTLSITSGNISSFLLGSGSVTSGSLGSGSIGFESTLQNLAFSGHFGTAAVVSGNLASGAVGSIEIGSASILPQNISSGVAAYAGFRYPNNFRLSIQSGVSVPTQDITSGGGVYLVPTAGGQISLFDQTTSTWSLFPISGQVTGLFGSGILAPYSINDIYVYYNYTGASSGRLSLFLSQWTYNSGRGAASNVADRDGILVYNGFPQYRYVGSFATQETISPGYVRVEDSAAKRHVYSAYNQVPRVLSNTVSGLSQAVLVVASPNPTTTSPTVEILSPFANLPVNYSMYIKFIYGDCPFAYSLQPYTSIRTTSGTAVAVGVVYNNSSQEDIVRSTSRYANLNTQEQRTLAGVNIYQPYVNCGNPTPTGSQTVGVGSGNTVTGTFNM